MKTKAAAMVLIILTATLVTFHGAPRADTVYTFTVADILSDIAASSTQDTLWSGGTATTPQQVLGISNFFVRPNLPEGTFTVASTSSPATWSSSVGTGEGVTGFYTSDQYARYSINVNSAESAGQAYLIGNQTLSSYPANLPSAFAIALLDPNTTFSIAVNDKTGTWDGSFNFVIGGYTFNYSDKGSTTPAQLTGFSFYSNGMDTFPQSNLETNYVNLNVEGQTTHLGYNGTASPVPVPAAVWLLGSGLAGLTLLRRKARGGRLGNGG
ncbi:MAG: VPLPA-CTERM sorting domain-containing protein [Desulfobacteraceae bacterium]|nr:VPLPA-CTERM sorting domain-containing protein [Desulfobacteraceae bacterium]